MFWIEDTTVDDGDLRVLFTTAGPFLLSVIEHEDGTAHWSCGVGENDIVDEREGTASDAASAMRAAIRDARSRWLETDDVLGALEADLRSAARDARREASVRLSSNRAMFGLRRAAGRVRPVDPPDHHRAG